MNGKVKFLFFCMIFVGGGAFAQKISVGAIGDNESLKFSNQYYKPHFYKLSVDKAGKKHFTGFPQTATQLPRKIAIIAPIPIISNNFYTQNFGFFCKKELQLEKVTKIPFKFRLGSVQQCDWMEGKTNAGIR